MAPYQYLPLVDYDIRLLSLSPRCSGEPRIRINIQKLSSTHRPQYEALSYVWGSKRFLRKITVDETDKKENSEHVSETKTPNTGAANSSRSIRTSTTRRSRAISRQAAQRPHGKLSLSITANLAQALHYLQLDEEERVLWIDAICIDQENLTERGQQVGRMADIFKMADRVVFWLGPADQHTQLAIETVDRLAAEVDVNFVTEEVFERSEGSMSHLTYDGATVKSLISLFERPWFERLWIWQEANARPDNAVVLLGGYSIMWNTIRKFLLIDTYTSHLRDMPTKFELLLSRARKLSRAAVQKDLISLLRNTTHCKCADNRDRIFALLGMMKPHNRLGIEPDYAKPAAEVFKQVVFYDVVRYQSLDVLRYCNMMHESDGMPSWVPRWSRESQRTSMSGRASPNIRAVAEYDGKGTLRVSGVEIGVVTSIQAQGLFTRVYYALESWPSFVSTFFSLLAAYEGEGELDRAMEAMMRTICRDHFETFKITQVRESLLRWREYLAKDKRHPHVCAPPPFSTGDSQFLRSVQNTLYRHSLFRTMEGYLGLCSKFAASGDKVCVVLGCDAPLVLRLISDDQWSIVGACYVDDIMDGSALLSSLPDDFQLIQRMHPPTGKLVTAFRNMQTNDIQVEDPRVTEALPAGWEIMKHENDSYKQLFGNNEQNLYTWNDPRLTPNVLRARGVKLKTYNLV